MSKYEPLKDHLASKGMENIPMTFSEIEQVIESSLPASARKHRAWWSNNPSNSVITHAWLEAGYRTAQVDLEGETLVFHRTRKDDRPDRGPKRPVETPDGRHPILGALKGQIRVVLDVDLTDPTGADWRAEKE